MFNKKTRSIFVRNLSILKLIPLFAISFTVSAQTPVYVDVSQCRNISVAMARVACYDALADQAMSQNGGSAMDRNPAPQSALPAQPVQSGQTGSYRDQMQEKNRKMREELARIRQEGSSGMSDGDSFGRSQQRVTTDRDGDRIMYDRIAGLQKSPEGWIVTLSSGQVWRQMYSKRYNLREGQQVKIAPTIWGNAYRLSVKELGSFIQVERVK